MNDRLEHIVFLGVHHPEGLFDLGRAPTNSFEIGADLLGGSTVPLLISSALLTDAKGWMTGAISYIRDTSPHQPAPWEWPVQ